VSAAGAAKGRGGRPPIGATQGRAAQGPEPARGPKPVVADTGQGGPIIWSCWIGTAVFGVAAALAAPLKGARLGAVIVDLGLFLGGGGVFLWALAVAAGRSRERNIELWSLFLLDGVAPARVRRALLGALAIEVVAALATAWISAALAFGCLVPLWALGHCGLWGARYGAFGPRPATSDPRSKAQSNPRSNRRPTAPPRGQRDAKG
jgi:hypothetical protein